MPVLADNSIKVYPGMGEAFKRRGCGENSQNHAGVEGVGIFYSFRLKLVEFRLKVSGFFTVSVLGLFAHFSSI